MSGWVGRIEGILAGLPQMALGRRRPSTRAGCSARRARRSAPRTSRVLRPPPKRGPQDSRNRDGCSREILADGRSSPRERLLTAGEAAALQTRAPALEPLTTLEKICTPPTSPRGRPAADPPPPAAEWAAAGRPASPRPRRLAPVWVRHCPPDPRRRAKTTFGGNQHRRNAPAVRPGPHLRRRLGPAHRPEGPPPPRRLGGRLVARGRDPPTADLRTSANSRQRERRTPEQRKRRKTRTRTRTRKTPNAKREREPRETTPAETHPRTPAGTPTPRTPPLTPRKPRGTPRKLPQVAAKSPRRMGSAEGGSLPSREPRGPSIKRRRFRRGSHWARRRARRAQRGLGAPARPAHVESRPKSAAPAAPRDRIGESRIDAVATAKSRPPSQPLPRGRGPACEAYLADDSPRTGVGYHPSASRLCEDAGGRLRSPPAGLSGPTTRSDLRRAHAAPKRRTGASARHRPAAGDRARRPPPATPL